MVSAPVLPGLRHLRPGPDLLDHQRPVFEALLLAVLLQVDLLSLPFLCMLLCQGGHRWQILSLHQRCQRLVRPLRMKLLHQTGRRGREEIDHGRRLHRQKVLEAAQNLLHPLKPGEHRVHAQLVGRPRWELAAIRVAGCLAQSPRFLVQLLRDLLHLRQDLVQDGTLRVPSLLVIFHGHLGGPKLLLHVPERQLAVLLVGLLPTLQLPLPIPPVSPLTF
mmetsp:Transcript_100870/g.240401  ORF Transcript_100870/g.240401 Transcript_100870/m.240401 type:complete len:219 (-) Transcript_100870:559-1215(-)